MYKTVTLFALILAASAITAINVHAQYGMPDPTFNPLDDGTYGDGPVIQPSLGWDFIPRIHHVHELPDGRILLAGHMNAYNSHEAPGIIRVHADGRLDESFVLPTLSSGSIEAMALLGDGRILLGGQFQIVAGEPLIRVLRLLPNGALDPDFIIDEGPNSMVKLILVQPDGRILIGGEFTSVGGTPRNRVARLHANGTLDQDFDPGLGVSIAPSDFALQADGRILLGGSFASVDGEARLGLARLSASGALDMDFDPAGATPAPVQRVLVDAQDRIIIAGAFTQLNGIPASRIARLYEDGSIDTTFDPGLGPDYPPNELVLLPDGRLLVGGYFSSWNNQDRPRLVRLEEDGSLDMNLDAQLGILEESVLVIKVQADGKILIGGRIYRIGAHRRNAVARLHSDGAIDTSFNPMRGPSDMVNHMEVLPDGRILIAGTFQTYNDIPRPRLALLTPDGLLDESFQPDVWVDQASVFSMVPISGQRILLGNNSPDPLIRLRCINLDGSDCIDFETGQGPIGTVFALAEFPDGRLLVAGSLIAYDGQSVDRIVRLMPDGSLDPSFVGPGPVNGTIRRVAVRGDGRILIAGSFTTISGQSRPVLAQLNPDGTLDAAFNAGPIPGTTPTGDSPVEAIVPQDDGTVLVGGCFSAFGGSVLRKGIVRIDDSGLVVPGFSTYFPPSWNSYFVTGMDVHEDGRILITGWFLEYGGHSSIAVARLLPSGEPDTTFSVGEGPWGWTTEPKLVRIQQDDRYIVAGQFIQFGGIPAHRIARIHGASGVGINDPEGPQALHAWPNPVQDLLHFEQPVAGRVFDAQGRTVLDLPNGTTQNVQALRPGMYMLRTLQGSVLRFVKQ